MRFFANYDEIQVILKKVEHYQNEMNTAFQNFESQLTLIVRKTNYLKLLKALRAIFYVYNDKILNGELKKLTADWRENRMSPDAFAALMDMGDESRHQIRKLEDRVEDLFPELDVEELVPLNMQGNPNVTLQDLQDTAQCFRVFVKALEQSRPCCLNEFESANELEYNELNRFMVPVLSAENFCLCSFFTAAAKGLETLAAGYEERMNKEKSRAPLYSNNAAYYDQAASSCQACGQKPQSAPAGQSAQNGRYASLIHALQCLNLSNSNCFDHRRPDYQNRLKERNRQLNNCYTMWKRGFKWRTDSLVNYRNNQLTSLELAYFQGAFSPPEFNAQRLAILQNGRRQYDQLLAEARQGYERDRQQIFWLFQNRVCQLEKQIYNTQNQFCKPLIENRFRYIRMLQNEQTQQSAVRELKQFFQNCHFCRKCPYITPVQQALFKINQQIGDTDDSALSFDRSQSQSETLPWDTERNQILEKYFPFQGKRLTLEEDLRQCNPNYKCKDDKDKFAYTHNCQRCVVTFEARMRGYNVTAQRRQKGDDPLATRNTEDGWPSVFVDKDGKSREPLCMNAATTAQSIERIKAKMKEYGNGARAIVGIGRYLGNSRHSGHVFIALQENGETLFVDPQTGSTNALNNFGILPDGICMNIHIKVKVCDPFCATAHGGEACMNCNITPSLRCKEITLSPKVHPSNICLLRIDDMKITDTVFHCCAPVNLQGEKQ